MVVARPDARELAERGWVSESRDPEAAASLLADGLAGAAPGRLVRAGGPA